MSRKPDSYTQDHLLLSAGAEKKFFINRTGSVAINLEDIAFVELGKESATPLLDVWLQSDGCGNSIELTTVEDIAELLAILRKL